MRIIKISIIYFLLLMPLHAFASDFFTGWFSDTGLSGYDPVAYFTQQEAVKGNSDYSASFGGVNWHMSSPEHLALFEKNPEKYVPQYGGYCANQAELGNKVGGDANLWLIHNDKLYVFGGEEGLIRWQKIHQEDAQ